MMPSTHEPTAMRERVDTPDSPDGFDGQAPAAMQALEERYERLPIDWITASKTNPRTHFDDAYLGELAGSIREKGVLQPILVRPLAAKKNGKAPAHETFEIIAGECRFRASRLAAQSHIPAIIRAYSDAQVLEIQLLENIHRKDLTALEEAKGYRALIQSNPDKHSAASIAQRIGMSETYVWDRLSLNHLIPEAAAILERGLMTVGHAILIARLKPEDQKRVVNPGVRNGFNHQREGLWQFNGGQLEFATRGDEEAYEKATKGDPYRDLKAVSVRELDAWIRDHVRFDVQHAAKAQPFQFETVAEQVLTAAEQPGRGKKVVYITHEYRVADDARDAEERTYGSNSWVRADGQQKSKTCEHSVLGVVVAGRGQGDTLQVCVARDKCKVHFAEVVKAKEQAAKQRAAGQTKKAAKTEKKAAESYDQKWKREEAERTARSKAWRAIEEHVIADAVAQVKGIKALTAAHAAALEKVEVGFNDIRKHLGASWFKAPAAALMVSAVTDFHFTTYGTKGSGFAQYVREVAKPFGLDVKRLEAIRDKHAPKDDAKAAPPAKKGKAKK